MIEKEYKIRRATTGDETAEITLPTSWKRYHKLKFGDKVKILGDGVIVILPPNTTKEIEEETRRFLEKRNEINHT